MKLLLRIIKDLPNNRVLYEIKDDWGVHQVDFLTAKEIHFDTPFDNAILVNDKYFKSKSNYKNKIVRDVIYDEFNGCNRETVQQTRQWVSDRRKGCGDVQESNARLCKQATSGTDLRTINDSINARRQSGQCKPRVAYTGTLLRSVASLRKVAPEFFVDTFNEVYKKNISVLRVYVDCPSLQEARNSKCLSIGGNKGFVMVKPDGTISALYKSQEYKAKDGIKFSVAAIYSAVANGGDRLDCFSREVGGLGNLYSRLGFIPICRLKFDRSKATDEQNKSFIVDPPDVYFFMYCDDDLKTYEVKALENSYPDFSEYDYIPYVTEFPEWWSLTGIKDAYEFGKHILDTAVDKWKNKYKFSFKDKFTEYTKRLFKGVK